MTPPPQLDELLRIAHGDLQFGMVAEAAHHLRQAASLAPEDPRIDLMLASAAAGRDDHAGVLTAIDRAIAKGLEPPPPIRFARIHALYTLGRIDEGVERRHERPAQALAGEFAIHLGESRCEVVGP